MLWFTERKDAPKNDPDGFAEMNRFARQLASQGKLRRGAPLLPEAAGARIRVSGGKALVTDGPFAESKEVVGGFWIVEVANRAEAIELARRTPHARYGIVEVYAVQWRDAVADSGEGSPFLFAFQMAPDLTDPGGVKMQEMVAYGEALKREGTFLETAPLAQDPPPARLETRGGKIVVTDGPFAESKEVVGGYSLVRVSDRAQAIEIARRYPHAKWGTVEVREIMFFDRT